MFDPQDLLTRTPVCRVVTRVDSKGVTVTTERRLVEEKYERVIRVASHE